MRDLTRWIPLAAAALLSAAGAHGSDAPLSCDQLDRVNVRVRDTRSADRNFVTLEARFNGVPSPDARIRVWWDYLNDAESAETFRPRVRLDENGRYRIQTSIQHAYDFREPTEVIARVELLLEDSSEGCARNQRLFVGSEPEILRREVKGSGGQEPETMRFEAVDPAHWRRVQLTVAVKARGARDAQMQVGLTENGGCCAWRAPFQIFAADGEEKIFSFEASIDYIADGATIGFQGVSAAEYVVVALFYPRARADDDATVEEPGL